MGMFGGRSPGRPIGVETRTVCERLPSTSNHRSWRASGTMSRMTILRRVTVLAIVVLCCASCATAKPASLGVSSAGSLARSFEALLRQTLGPAAVCERQTAQGDDFESGTCSPLSEYSPYVFTFNHPGATTLTLSSLHPGNFGNYPVPIEIRGRSVLCNSKARTFLVRYADTASFTLACLSPLSVSSSPSAVAGKPAPPRSGIYVDGGDGTPHYYMVVAVSRSGQVSGSVQFAYQDGQTSVVFTFSGRASDGVATLTPVSIPQVGSASEAPSAVPSTISMTYGADDLQLGECVAYLHFAESVASCTFSYSNAGPG